MEKIVFWKDRERGTIEPTLFSKMAEDLAERLAKEGKVNKRTQIRKFYDEVLRLDNEAQSNPTTEQWENILPRLHMLIAKAVYAQGRELVSPDFVKFIKSSINQIQQKEDLSVFTNFFEAFMGFYRLYRKD
ncbi:MAG: type III-A CRISPR-associated protein Csm2 [Desulfobacca sp. 4484_104]|nr:MAG: type III-A CRISPR-associated protein Csm2 [Desulfobacca sp. 4484_104]